MSGMERKGIYISGILKKHRQEYHNCEGVDVKMPFVVIVLALSIGLGIFLSRKYQNKSLIIWGLITMLSIAPFFSWIVAMLVGVSVGDGFAAVAVMWLMVPTLFLIGVGMLGAGVYKKVTGENL